MPISPYSDFDASAQAKVKQVVNLGHFENCTVELFQSCRIASSEDQEKVADGLYRQTKKALDKVVQHIRAGAPYALKLEKDRQRGTTIQEEEELPPNNLDLSDREMTVGATVKLTINLGDYESIALEISRYQRVEKGEGNVEMLEIVYLKCKLALEAEEDRVRAKSPYAQNLRTMRQKGLKASGTLPDLISVTHKKNNTVVGTVVSSTEPAATKKTPISTSITSIETDEDIPFDDDIPF